MPRAIVLGGNGQVGAAAALKLAADGWAVTSSGRSADRFPQELRQAGVRFTESDRYKAEDLRELLGEGADVVIDCVGYTAAHARMLLPFGEDIGSLVFISSKAVYVDDHGRHVNSDEPPAFGGPVTEEQPTMAPSEDVDYNSAEGYGANKVAAENVLLDSGMAVSVLRPSRVHGAGSGRPREWVFVKRVLDGRRHLLLARGGRGANHPTAAVNLAALIAFCAARPGVRILNSADPDAPDGLAIARVIAAYLAHEWTEVLLDETAPEGLGDHPWNTLPPVVLDTSAAQRLGFVPVGTYAETVRAEIDWLVQAARPGGSGGGLPALDEPFFLPFFDYDREDAWLAGRTGSIRLPGFPVGEDHREPVDVHAFNSSERFVAPQSRQPDPRACTAATAAGTAVPTARCASIAVCSGPLTRRRRASPAFGCCTNNRPALPESDSGTVSRLPGFGARFPGSIP